MCHLVSNVTSAFTISWDKEQYMASSIKKTSCGEAQGDMKIHKYAQQHKKL